MKERAKIVVPGDNPTQIGGSPHLERLGPYGDLELFTATPADSAEKIARAEGAQVIINNRGLVTWREEMRSLPDLNIAKELGIVVSNQPGRTAPVVAAHMFGVMFALAQRACPPTPGARDGGDARVVRPAAARAAGAEHAQEYAF